MALNPYLWSTTPITNEASDSGINWAEGQLPGTVNSSARGMMSSIAGWLKDSNGTLTTGGAANAYTVTSNVEYAALATGLRLVVKANHTNTGASTLVLTPAGGAAFASKAIRAMVSTGDVALAANQIISGGLYELVYSEAANAAAGAWLLQTPTINANLTTLSGFSAADITDLATLATATAANLVTLSTATAANLVTLSAYASADALVAATTIARIYYVRTDGNDSNTGLVNNAGGAKLTLQGAWDAVAKHHLGGLGATISVAAGTYTAGFRDIGKPAIGGTVSIVGAGSTTTTIAATSNDCVEICCSSVLVTGFKLTNSNGSAFHAYRSGQLQLVSDINVGTCSEYHFFCDNQGQILQANYTISGNADAHMHAHTGGYIGGAGLTVTIDNGGGGAPAFSTVFARAVIGGIIEASGNTYSGTDAAGVTGSRHYVDSGGVIYTGTTSLTYFPGNAAGTVRNGAYGDSLQNVYLPAGGVIDFNTAGITITESSDALAFAGASAGYSFAGPSLQVSNSGGNVELLLDSGSNGLSIIRFRELTTTRWSFYNDGGSSDVLTIIDDDNNNGVRLSQDATAWVAG